MGEEGRSGGRGELGGGSGQKWRLGGWGGEELMTWHKGYEVAD